MVCLNYTDEVKGKIFDYFQRILTEFIEDEKRINKCYEIKNRYISHIDDINNTNSYVRDCFDVIVSMDRVNKYICNIAKLLIDNITGYNEYLEWQRKTTNINEKIRDEWKLIYNIRCKIEHPNDLQTTMFTRKGENIDIPQVIYKGEHYDLLELSDKAIQYVFLFFKLNIGAAYLNSKYVIAFTDETRRILYKP